MPLAIIDGFVPFTIKAAVKWHVAKTVAVSPTSSLVSQTDAEGGLASTLKKKQFRKGRSKSFFLTYQFIERTVAVISFSVRATDLPHCVGKTNQTSQGS